MNKLQSENIQSENPTHVSAFASSGVLKKSGDLGFKLISRRPLTIHSIHPRARIYFYILAEVQNWTGLETATRRSPVILLSPRWREIVAADTSNLLFFPKILCLPQIGNKNIKYY